MDYERLKIREYAHWTVYLAESQYYLGRMYIWSKRDPPGLKDIFRDTTEAEWNELRAIGKDLEKALGALFQPDLINWASLGNEEKHGHHCHMHVVPRYKTVRNFLGIAFVDANWGKNWAPYSKDFTITEKALERIKDAIVEQLSQPPQSGGCCGGSCQCK